MIAEKIWLFQTAATNNIPVERIAIILGIITLLLVLMTFASCRSCTALLSRLGLKNIINNRIYHTFYRYHAYYWWFLGIAVLSHLMIAVVHTGWPQASDPDSSIHWMSLILGFINISLVLALFSSCRISPKLIKIVKPDLSLNNPSYQNLFHHHGLFWATLILIVAGHITAGYLHSGIWPQ